jgi:hypothetical protein
LVWAGHRWPVPLLEQAWALARPERPLQLALALVLLPPLLMAWVLLRGLLRLPAAGRPTPTGENRPTERMETR